VRVNRQSEKKQNMLLSQNIVHLKRLPYRGLKFAYLAKGVVLTQRYDQVGEKTRESGGRESLFGAIFSCVGGSYTPTHLTLTNLELLLRLLLPGETISKRRIVPSKNPQFVSHHLPLPSAAEGERE